MSPFSCKSSAAQHQLWLIPTVTQLDKVKTTNAFHSGKDSLEIHKKFLIAPVYTQRGSQATKSRLDLQSQNAENLPKRWEVLCVKYEKVKL